MKEEIKSRICRDDIARAYHSNINGYELQTVKEIENIIEQMSSGGLKSLMNIFNNIDSKNIYDDLKQDGKSTIFFLQKIKAGYRFSISAGVGSIN